MIFSAKVVLLAMVLGKGNYSEGSNAARILKIFKLGAKLQSSVYYKFGMV